MRWENKNSKEVIKMVDKEECECDEGISYGYFTHQGIERKGMYCKKCGQLLDYIPQYSEDNL